MFYNPNTQGTFVMPKDVEKYINNAKKSELKVIMYLFSHLNSFDIAQAAHDLSESEEAVRSALSFWRGTGLIFENDDENSPEVKPQKIKAPVEKEQSYSTLDVANAAIEDEEFRHIIKFCESTLGDLPNAARQAQLYYLYSGLGMQSDVIMGIIAHCASIGKTRMDYIKRTAEGIHNDGVVTYKELENYLREKDEYKKFEAVVKRVIGCGERAFTKSEKMMVQTWEKQWGVDEQMLNLAYERTISLISKPSLPYMSKILENWHKEGIDTADKARQALEKQSKASKNQSTGEKSSIGGFEFELEDIYEKP